MIIYSAADMECTAVEDLADGYKCYFDTKNGQVRNGFELNDQARCQRFEIANTTMKYYWRLVTEVGDDYIVLSKSDCEAKPAAAKGQYVRSCTVVSTMGPGIKINGAKLV